jgi:hypothetical protein
MGKAKGGIDFNQHLKPDLGSADSGRVEAANNFDPEVLVKKELSAKHADIPDYEKIFIMPLDMEKSIKKPTVLYSDNNERLDALSAILPNINKTDALNYIVKAYFDEHSNEIKKSWDRHQKNKRSIF